MSQPLVNTGEPKRIFFVIGEASGDQLGASLVDSLRARFGGEIAFEGLAGDLLQARGVQTVFDIEDIAVMGLGPVIARLPTILRRLRTTVEAIVSAKPDLVVVIDSPDFCHRVAKRVRARDASIPIVGWVSPSVWAWRPSRAIKMRAYIDHLLVLLPFEVETHAELGGPPATYVGHPLVSQQGALASAEDMEQRQASPVLLVLPGSRKGEITRHMQIFGQTVERASGLVEQMGSQMPPIVLPTIEKHAHLVQSLAASWQVPTTVVADHQGKKDAFARGHAALAASGTVTLELALKKVPMIVVYRLDWLASRFRFLIKVWTIVLPNLIIGRPVIREYVEEFARPEILARGLASLIVETPERLAQLAAFEELSTIMQAKGDADFGPADRAADVVANQLGLS
ncbi:MAG: lipid-A-disaccharide synthase [Pseudomonadota bacterium]